MSDEEKKAIEYWKTHMEILHWNTQLASEYYIKVLLDLIDKQQKEIEELKEENKTLKNLQNDTNRLYTEMIERKNYFERELQKLEDKIKAKIEKWDKDIKWNNADDHYYAIKMMQSLLEKE